MANKSYLIQQAYNHVLDIIKAAKKNKEKYLPSDLALATKLGISRTTVRTVLDLVIENGFIQRELDGKKILKTPLKSSYFSLDKEASSKEEVIRKYFMSLISNRKLKPGTRFSELDLAKQSGCNTVTVREFLIKFSRFGLIEKSPRSQWQMIEFDEQYSEELIELRKLLEMRALIKLLNTDAEHPTWLELKDLLKEHKAVKKDFKKQYHKFPDLDAKLHILIQRGANNRFINQFFDIVSFVYHYHYQWSLKGEEERFKIAIDEHIQLLTAILNRDTEAAISALEVHLNSADQTLRESSHQAN